MIRFAHESGYALLHVRFSHFRSSAVTFAAMPPSTRRRRLLILIPRLDSEVVDIDGAEGVDERCCEACIGEQWHVEVNSRTTNVVANIVLWVGHDILWNAHYELNYAFAHEVDSLWSALL